MRRIQCQQRYCCEKGCTSTPAQCSAAQPQSEHPCSSTVMHTWAAVSTRQRLGQRAAGQEQHEQDCPELLAAQGASGRGSHDVQRVCFELDWKGSKCSLDTLKTRAEAPADCSVGQVSIHSTIPTPLQGQLTCPRLHPPWLHTPPPPRHYTPPQAGCCSRFHSPALVHRTPPTGGCWP